MRYSEINRHFYKEKVEIVGKCPLCNNDVLLKMTRYGTYRCCAKCDYKVLDDSSKSSEKCPKCGKELIIVLTKRGRKILSCNSCNYARWVEKENITKNNTKYNVKKGTRNDVDEDVMSSWEANIIRLFKYLNIEYKYESDSYKLNGGYKYYKYASFSYVPDFVLNDGTLVEVKGNLDYRSLQNMKLFQELYPDEKIMIIDRDIYYLLNKKYSSLIDNWEHCTMSLMSYILVVGIQIGERNVFVENLNVGDEVYIFRDKNNEYDKNAIKVLDKGNNVIGYIASEYACYYAPKIDKGIKYNLIIKNKEEKTIKCSIIATNLDDYNVNEFYDKF